MKKTALLLALLAFVCAGGAYAEEILPSVYINGTEVEFNQNAKPYIDTEINLTMLPVRGIWETCSASVVWDGENKAVTGMRGDKFFTLQIGEATAFINGEEYTLETPAVIKNDTTFVPLRFVMEALGAEVQWDGENQAVMIKMAEFLN